MWQAMLAKFGADTAGSYVAGMLNKSAIEAQNKAKKEANTINTQQTAQAIGQLEVRKGFLRGDAAIKENAIEKAGLTASSRAQAQAAALGVKGASVQAVKQQTEMEVNKAVASMIDDTLMQEYNMNLQAIQLATQARLNLHKYDHVPSEGEVLRGALAKAAIGSAASYFDGGGTSFD